MAEDTAAKKPTEVVETTEQLNEKLADKIFEQVKAEVETAETDAVEVAETVVKAVVEETKEAVEVVVEPKEEPAPAEPEVVEPEDIFEGSVQKKRSFYSWHNKYLFFGDKELPLENLVTLYKKHAKKTIGPQSKDVNLDLHKTIAYATQTGKGLLYYTSSKDAVDRPQGAILLSTVTSVAASKSSLQFKITTKSRSWDFSQENKEDVARWVSTINKKVEEAKSLPSLEESEEYKAVLGQLTDGSAFKGKVAAKEDIFSGDEGEPEDENVKKEEAPAKAELIPEVKVAGATEEEPVPQASTSTKVTKHHSFLGSILKKKPSPEPPQEIKEAEETPAPVEPTAEASAAPEEPAAPVEEKEDKVAEKADEKRKTRLHFPFLTKKPAAEAPQVAEGAEETVAAPVSDTEEPKEEAAPEAPVEAKPSKGFLGIFGKKAEAKKEEAPATEDVPEASAEETATEPTANPETAEAAAAPATEAKEAEEATPEVTSETKTSKGLLSFFSSKKTETKKEVVPEATAATEEAPEAAKSDAETPADPISDAEASKETPASDGEEAKEETKPAKKSIFSRLSKKPTEVKKEETSVPDAPETTDDAVVPETQTAEAAPEVARPSSPFNKGRVGSLFSKIAPQKKNKKKEEAPVEESQAKDESTTEEEPVAKGEVALAPEPKVEAEAPVVEEKKVDVQVEQKP